MDSACKILVAEDDKFLSRAYEFKLKKAGCNIILANDGEEAIAKIRAEKPNLILLDLIMPKKSGFDVLSEIKNDAGLKEIPVIIMSNLGQESDVKKGLDAGAIDYVVKANTSLEEVVGLIKQTLKTYCGMNFEGLTSATVEKKKIEKTEPAEKRCGKCGTVLSDSAKFCPDCGTPTGLTTK